MNCLNLASCQLVRQEGFLESEVLRDNYIKEYCRGGEENWRACKRFLIHQVLHFCPDSVLPDTPQTVDKIIDDLEEAYSKP